MAILGSLGCGATGRVCLELGAGDGAAFQPSIQVEVKACIAEGTPMELCYEHAVANWESEWSWPDAGGK